MCDTFLLSHCSSEDRFRQAKFLQVLIHLTDILMASERRTDSLEGLRGRVAKKNYTYGKPRNLNICA